MLESPDKSCHEAEGFPELQEKLVFTPLEKNKSPTRWIILVLGCLMLVGSYYCFDIPAALKTQLDDYMGDPSDYELKFGLLYTLYAAPNVILPFFGGYFVDTLGVRISLLVFCTLIALGQVVFCVGVSLKNWPVIFLGRLIFGFGGESFTVANSVLLADWFKGRELAFAFGINLSVAKLGSVLNNILSPMLTNDIGILFALWFGAILCAFSVFCVVLTMPIDKAFDDKIAAQQKYQLVGSDMKTTGGAEVDVVSVLHTDDDAGASAVKCDPSGEARISYAEPEGPPAVAFDDVFKLEHIFWVLVISCMVVYGCVLPFNNISSSLLLERDYFMEPPSGCQLEDPSQCQGRDNQPINCPSSKWYQPPLPSMYTASDIDCGDDFWSASGGCAEEYCSRLTDAESEASVIMSIPYIISAALSPPLGFAVDVYGMRAIIAAIAPAILIAVHLMLAYSDVNVVIPLIGQGLAYTGFVSVLWPAVPLVVEERVSGLAFGIVTSGQNLACALVPLVIAGIYSDSGDKYIPNVELMFVAFAGIGFIVGLYMNYYDMNHGHVLNRTAAAAEKALKEEAESGLMSSRSSVYQTVATADPEATDSISPLASGAKEHSRGHESWAHRRSEEGRVRSRSSSGDRHSYTGGLHNRRSRASKDGHAMSFTIHEEMLRGGAYHNADEAHATDSHPEF